MKKVKHECNLIMGKPGSGKSLYMAYLVKKSLRQGRKVYTNHHVLGAEYLDTNWLGRYDLYDVDIIIDEAQIVWDNRDFKTFSKEMKFFISNFRHFKCRLYIISQSYEDLDVKIRRQAHNIYIVQPSIIPYTFMLQKINMKFGISEDESNIVTKFKSSILGLRFHIAPILYKYFDSYSRPNFPVVPIHDKWGLIPKSFKLKDFLNKKIFQFNKKKKLTMLQQNDTIIGE